MTSKAADYYVGAFGGNLGANIVTNSYYDSGATKNLADWSHAVPVEVDLDAGV